MSQLCCQALGGVYGAVLRPSASHAMGSTRVAVVAAPARPLVTLGRPLRRASLFDPATSTTTTAAGRRFNNHENYSAYSQGFNTQTSSSFSSSSSSHVRGGGGTTPSAYYGDAPAMDTGAGAGSTPAPPTVDWDVRSVNSVTLIGHCGGNPELREFGSGACVANVSLAIRGRRSNNNGGAGMGMDMGGGGGMGGDQVLEEGDTHWVECEAWGDDARQLVDHVTKGRQIMVTGRLKENTWMDKMTGQKRSKLKVSMYNFAFVAPYNGSMGGGGGGGGGAGMSYGGGGGAVADPYAAQAEANGYVAPAATAAGAAMAEPAYVSSSSSGGGGGGDKDDKWRDLIANPDAWWDNRERKAAPGGNPRYPDFKHKDDQTPLWIESRDTPQWAVDALVGGGGGGMGAMASGASMAAAGGAGNDGFDPYYAPPPDDYSENYGGGATDYSQPYGADLGGGGGGGGDGGVPGVAYEPAKPFDDDEPPF